MLQKAKVSMAIGVLSLAGLTMPGCNRSESQQQTTQPARESDPLLGSMNPEGSVSVFMSQPVVFSVDAPIRTEGLTICSFVILTNGSTSGAVHMPPDINLREKVVSQLITGMHEREIPLSDCVAIIDAGLNSSGEALKRLFEEKGVRVAYSEDTTGYRDSLFDPSSNTLHITSYLNILHPSTRSVSIN